MDESKEQMLSKLAIAPEKKTRGGAGTKIFFVVLALLIAGLGAAYFKTQQAQKAASGGAVESAKTNAPVASALPEGVILQVSGYVIPRQRIEISPKFIGTVKSINVKKGDAVKAGDVLVTLEDDEHRARVIEAQGRVKMSEANVLNAEIQFARQTELAKINAQSQQALDEAKRNIEWSAAELVMVRGQLALAQTYLGWCTIRAPIDGVILEKMVNPNELVTPQSFGGSGGPRTAFLAMADLTDMQVEIDLSEVDTPKVSLNQKCRISPEAYPDKKYEGYVAEIAPEASRAKGTLQVKVQIKNPDRFLTPELQARVDFLKADS